MILSFWEKWRSRKENTVNHGTEEELSALRQYMQETTKGIMPHRSTAAYALEFLKTSRANLQDAYQRYGEKVQDLDSGRKS